MAENNNRKPVMTINGDSILAAMKTDLGDAAMRHYDTVLAYPDMIERMEAQAQRLFFLYEGEEYRDEMTKLDTTRRRKHDAAMASLNTLNKICEKEGIAPVTDPVDFSDLHRADVGDAICEHVKEVLDNDRYKEQIQNQHERRMPDTSDIKRKESAQAQLG